MVGLPNDTTLPNTGDARITGDVLIGGNVGIGTGSTQDARLFVNGALRLEKGSAVNEFTTSLGDTDQSQSVPTSDAVKTYVAGLNAILPAGMIVMWNGTTIPSGWVLCDGNNGTPDLRDRFILGAGPSPSTEPGCYGDGDPHSHNVGMLTVSSNTTVAGQHDHRFPKTWCLGVYGNGPHEGINTPFGPKEVSIACVQEAGGYSHDVTVVIPEHNTISAGALKPKWYALCFIMKI